MSCTHNCNQGRQCTCHVRSGTQRTCDPWPRSRYRSQSCRGYAHGYVNGGGGNGGSDGGGFNGNGNGGDDGGGGYGRDSAPGGSSPPPGRMRGALVLWLVILLSLFWTGRSRAAIIDSTDTFAVCKSVDVVTTSHLLSHGLGHEANPIMAPVAAGGFIPLALVGLSVWWLLRLADSRPATTVANVVTCGAALNNLLLLR